MRAHVRAVAVFQQVNNGACHSCGGSFRLFFCCDGPSGTLISFPFQIIIAPVAVDTQTGYYLASLTPRYDSSGLQCNSFTFSEALMQRIRRVANPVSGKPAFRRDVGACYYPTGLFASYGYNTTGSGCAHVPAYVYGQAAHARTQAYIPARTRPPSPCDPRSFLCHARCAFFRFALYFPANNQNRVSYKNKYVMSTNTTSGTEPSGWTAAGTGMHGKGGARAHTRTRRRTSFAITSAALSCATQSANFRLGSQTSDSANYPQATGREAIFFGNNLEASGTFSSTYDIKEDEMISLYVCSEGRVELRTRRTQVKCGVRMCSWADQR